MLWVCLLVLLVVLTVSGHERDDRSYQEYDNEVVYRVAREAKAGRNKATGSECRYKKGPWQDCDSSSNMQTRTLTLKRGDARCDQTRIMTKKCKKACRYEKGEWSDCNAAGVRSRSDKLKSKSDPVCEAAKTVTKPCKNVGGGGGGGAGAGGGACRYNRNVAWTSCDPLTGKKSKVMRLSDGPADCPPSKTLEKNCRKGKGRDKNGSDDE